MKTIIQSLVLLLTVSSTNAYEIYQGPPAGRYSDTVTLVNSAGSAVSAADPLPVVAVANPASPPLLQQDLIGNANNYYANKKRGFMFGRVTGVGNARIDIWGGPTPVYVFPSVPQQMRVVSTSASDAALGTGTRKIILHYLDTNYVYHEEEITLNGVTPVLTVATNILRINGLHASSVGTGGVSAGDISVTNTAGTVTYGFISIGYNTGLQAIYTVPAGKTGYITHWQASSGSSGAHFCQTDIRATTHDGILIPGVFLSQDQAGTQNNGTSINFSIPIPIPATSDVKMSVVCDAGNANATAIGAIMGWFE